MTESEWLAATNPKPMLEFLRDKASNRKLTLFMVAALRRCFSEVARKHDEYREELIQIEVAERYADGRTSINDLRDNWPGGPSYPETPYAWAEALIRSNASVGVLLPAFPPPNESIERLRDILGNPFRPVAFSAVWRTSTAVMLAQQMYESRDFSAMPILADALQDADCDNKDMLQHCRQPGEHVRGCWVVDLVLGKE